MRKHLQKIIAISVFAILANTTFAQTCINGPQYLGGDNRPQIVTSTINVSQSFQSYYNGVLNRVSLDIGASNSGCTLSDIQAVVKIYDGDSITGAVLASKNFTLPLNITQTYYEFVFDTPANVEIDSMYTIDISLLPGQDCGAGNEPELIWYFSFPTNFWAATGGTQYISGNVASFGNTQKFKTCLTCDYTAPTASSTQELCEFSTISDLTVTGQSLTWYEDNMATIYLSPSDTLNDGQTYYVSNYEDNCESPVIAIDVTVNDLPVNTVSTSGAVITADANNASYQWLDCDNSYSVIAGETNQSFTPIANGNYAVEITSNGCSDTSACESFVGLSINENGFGDSFVIYPNPSRGELNIDLGQNTESMQISVISLDGKEIFSNSYNEQLIRLDLSSLPRGVYIINITDGENQSFHKVTKQ